jgi:hypothetical protein
MPTYLKFASIPIGLFTVFFLIPRLYAFLINSHTDFGLAALILVSCGLFGVIGKMFYDAFQKENEENEG